MSETQEERMKFLLDKYAAFIHQTPEEKTKVVRLCGILAYLEAVEAQGMTINEAKNQLEKFLNKITVAYSGPIERTEA